MKAHWTALTGLAAVLFLALFICHMPVKMAFAAGGYGVIYGLLPIGWLILNVVFLKDITGQTGQFEIVRQSIARFSDDRRIQALLIASVLGRSSRARPASVHRSRFPRQC